MKIIDILNKIANGEQPPKKIRYNDYIFEYEDAGYFSGEAGYLFERYYPDIILNDEVEILDNIKNNKQDKIDKLSYQQIGSRTLEQHNWIDYARAVDKQIQQIGSKINEIIEALNEKQ